MYITNIQKQLYSSCTQRANVLKPDKKKGRAVVSFSIKRLTAVRGYQGIL